MIPTDKPLIYQDADGRIRGCGVGEDGMLLRQVRGGETCEMTRVAERHFSLTERMRAKECRYSEIVS